MAGDDAAAAALKEAQEAKAKLAETEATVKTLQDEMNALRELRTAASSSTIGVKTTIETPALVPKMTFADYKWEVENWCTYTKGHFKEEDMAWLLLNKLPATDDKQVKRTVIEKVTMDKLRTKEGVKLMLDEMQKILECEPFVRLVEWMQSWETLSQGGKPYEKYTSTLRKLAKTAEDDFKFKLPQQFLVAKLLLGCSAVKGGNISMITHGIDLNGLGDNLYAEVEAKVKGFISTTNTFTSIKAGGEGHSHVLSTFSAKDWQGNPIVTPEKVSVPSPNNSNENQFGATNEEIAEALIAYKKDKNKSAYSRLGGKHESKEDRRARMIASGLCFEYGCDAPATHVFENCPTRKKRIEKRKAEVIKSGGVWYDDPKEAKRQNETQGGSGQVKKVHVQTVKHADITPPLQDDEVIGDVFEEDLVLQDDDDEEKYLSTFRGSRILMASSHYDVSEKLHQVNFTRSKFDEALLDSGCEKNCVGEVAYDSYLETLSTEDRADVKEFEGHAKFKFGGAGIYSSQKEVLVPFYVAGVRMKLRLDVVRTDIPILVGLPVLKELDLAIKYTKKGQDYGFFRGQRFKINHRQGHHYLKISKQGSIDALAPEEEDQTNRGTFSTFIGKVRVFDKAKMKSQLKQIHTNYAHITKDKMLDIIKGAGQYEPEMSGVLDEIIEECPVKRCRTRKHTQTNAKAAFRQATSLGDLVTTDLKIRSSGKSIMYIIDYATSYAVGALIDNKSSEECARVLVRNWYGNGLPRIKMMTSDNGREYVGKEFREVLQRFSTARKFTVPFHPEMNGACERIHALVDLNMAKLQEESPGLDDRTALIWALLAYNATPTVTGYSPAQLVYGVKNVLTPGQDLTPVECQEPESDSRYVKELLIRDEAIANHNVIRNSRKLREVVLGRSKPTPDKKAIGSWVWFRRHDRWLGPAQVGVSLAAECSVKEGNVWYNAKHSELLPLNNEELKAHNLLPTIEEEDMEVDEEVSQVDPQDDNVGVIEVEHTVESLIEASKNPPQLATQPSPRRKGVRSGASTWNDSLNSDHAALTESGPSQVTTQDLGSRSDQQALGLRGVSPEVPNLLEGTDTETDSESQDEATTTHTLDTNIQMGRSPSPVGTQPPLEAGGSTQERVRQEIANQDHQAQPTGRQELPQGFDPNLANRPAIDVAVNRLKAKQEVRIVNPDTNEVQDVTVLNGYRKASQKSWYRVKSPQGNAIYDFNEIIWDFKHNTNLYTKRARVDPDKTYVINHTIIHPSQHNTPGVIEAKAAEIENHTKFGTFSMIPENSLTESQRQKIIPSTWAVVYKGPPGAGKIKARLCARGDKEPDLDMVRTDAPTAAKDSIRILLSLAASTGWRLHSLDFQAAFIQGRDIDRELYMRPPPDVRESNPGMIFRIVKRLYGLKDASRGWVLEVRDYLISCGMEQSQMDRAVFYIKNQRGEIYGMIVTHIDDFLFIGNEIFHQEVIHKVLKRYVVGTLEDTSLTFTGWQLEQDSQGITLSQKSYHDQIQLEPYAHMKLYTAKDENLLGESDQTLYRKMCGVLNWLVTSSKPALAHTCNKASASLGKATKAQAKMLIRVLEKAKSDPETIRFSNLGNPKNWHIDVYADAALGKCNDPETYIGDIAFLSSNNGRHNVINWAASKLDIPTASILNGEAEAVTNAHGKVKYLRYIFNELLSTELPATIHTDSKSLYQTVISDNSIRNRRISAAVATIRSVKTKENIVLNWVKGLSNLSDPLTKPNANASGLKHILTTGKVLKVD